MAEAVFDELARLIIAGDLVPGSNLPSEREVSEQFGVSKLIARQAIHRLADLGLVRVRQGGATVVVDPEESDHPMVSVMALRWSPIREGLLVDLRERQLAGSVSMIILAARKCTEDDVAGLRTMVEEAEKDEALANTVNGRFWVRIAEITSNAFFKRETRFWFRMSDEDPRLEHRVDMPTAVQLSGFRQIVDALEAGEGAAETHLRIIEMLLDVLETDGV